MIQFSTVEKIYKYSNFCSRFKVQNLCWMWKGSAYCFQ